MMQKHEGNPFTKKIFSKGIQLIFLKVKYKGANIVNICIGII